MRELPIHPVGVGGVVVMSAGAGGGPCRAGLDAIAASAAPPVPVPVADEYALLACVEARLTEEMRRLVLAIRQFSSGAQSVCEEFDSAGTEVLKDVPIFFGLAALKIADGLEKFADAGVFLEHGVLDIDRLLSEIDKLFKKFEFEGQQFLAIALPNKSAADFFGCADGRQEC